MARTYEGGFTLKRACPETGRRDAGNVQVWVDEGDPHVDLHLSLYGVNGSAGFYQQLRPDEARELAAALLLAVQAAEPARSSEFAQSAGEA